VSQGVSVASLLAGQEIREVGARELRHNAAGVVRAVRDGERTIVTRHGEPQAVMLSVKDAIELLMEAQLAPIVDGAERDLREGPVEALEPPGPFPAVSSNGSWSGRRSG
jgi:prevent-host-death family protein